MDTNNECKLRINTIRYPASFVISASVSVVAVSINSYLFYKVDMMTMKMGKDKKREKWVATLITDKKKSINSIYYLFVLTTRFRQRNIQVSA